MKWILLLFTVFSLQAQNIQIRTFEDQEKYPVSAPYHEEYLPVSDLHQIYFAEFGNPDGIPVLAVHGGPGWGCPASWSSFFDCEKYHVIMFDQRGAMRSTPFAEMQDNTPQNSVQDMEKLREHLGIDKWILFGGSWGSTLSLLYGETHPDRVLSFVLRGVFLARQKDYEYLFYGMKDYYPEAWSEMVAAINESEGCDLITVLHQQVMSNDPVTYLKAAHAFMKFDTLCGSILPDKEAVQESDEDDLQTLSVARAYIHYSANQFFMEENQLLKNISRITHIPAIIVQGRHDHICPPTGAYELHRRWDKSILWIVPDAAHFSSEPSIAKGLKEAMDQISAIIDN